MPGQSKSHAHCFHLFLKIIKKHIQLFFCLSLVQTCFILTLGSTHLVFMVLAEAHTILEEGQQGKVVLQRLCEGHRHPWLARVVVGVDPAQVEILSQALDEVVLGQPHPLVCPHTVVTQILLAVKAVRGSWVLLVAGAALGLSQVVRVQQASMRVMEAGGASA